jgi:hypothetical protein
VPKPTLPKWKDEAGVAKLVEEILAERQIASDHFRNCQPRFNTPFDLDDAVIGFRLAEEGAVEAAYRGDIVPLTELLRDPHRNWLLPSTVELVVEFMTGKRNPQTGKPKGAVGRRKMTSEQRLAVTPIHRAAFDFRAIQGVLREHYPSERVRERALELAAGRAKVEPENLRRYLGRSRRDRRRLG